MLSSISCKTNKKETDQVCSFGRKNQWGIIRIAPVWLILLWYKKGDGNFQLKVLENSIPAKQEASEISDLRQETGSRSGGVRPFFHHQQVHVCEKHFIKAVG